MENQKRPGRRGYAVGAGVFFFGGIVFFLITTLGTRNNLRQEQAALEDLSRSPVPAEEQAVELKAADRLVIFIEHPEDVADRVDVVLVSEETGEPVDFFAPVGIARSEYESVNTDPYAQFELDKGGVYRLSSAFVDEPLEPAPVVALGPWPENEGSVLLLLVGWGGLILCLLGGPLTALRTFILRRRHPATAD